MITPLDPAPALLCSRAAGCPDGGPDADPRPGPLAAGEGVLRVERVDGASAVVACGSASPLRLLLPRPRGPLAWAVAASHGGGLVGGDAIAIDLAVGAGARALLTTQAETKVYRTTGRPCAQRLRAEVGPGALLALLPEPVSAFAGSALSQRQAVALAADASLVLVDAIAAGRTARGERWAFDALASANEVSVAGRPLLAETLRLARGEGPPVEARLGPFDLLATVVLLGPALRAPAAALRAELAARPAAAGDAVLAAASPLGDGLHLRLAARSVEAGQAALRGFLAFLPGLLGEDPLSRRP